MPTCGRTCSRPRLALPGRPSTSGNSTKKPSRGCCRRNSIAAMAVRGTASSGGTTRPRSFTSPAATSTSTSMARGFSCSRRCRIRRGDRHPCRRVCIVSDSSGCQDGRWPMW